MRPVEFNGVIGRTEIQKTEDSRPYVEQHNANVIQDKNIENKFNQVNKKEETFMNSKFDAKEEGKGTYQENNNSDKKKQKDGTVEIKKKTGFDVRI